MALTCTLQQQIDGTTLTFIVEKDSVAVRIGRWKIKTNKIDEMNRFVDLHFKEIDPAKTVVYGDDHAKYPTFKPVIEVLKKHDWIKFRFERIGQKSDSAVPAVRATKS